MAKQYSRPAFPYIHALDDEYSSPSDELHGMMKKLEKDMVKYCGIPAKILEGTGVTMKYKVGDRVCICKNNTCSDDARVRLEACNYIVTIKRVINNHGHYEMEKYGLICHDKNIIGLYKEPEPIDNRFEILDL